MCGIVGVITTDDNRHEYSKKRFMTEGLYVDALRGMHGTGIMGLSKDFEWNYLKQAVPAAKFLNTENWDKTKFNQWCMVGHNRHATMGEHTTENTHPFRQGEILLVHNGTLRSLFNLQHKNHDLNVDSQQIAYNLSQVEPEEAPEVISRLSGAYALVWFDNRDSSVNMVRNHERPLHLGLSRDEQALWFMSEGHMLRFLTERFSSYQAVPDNIWQLQTGRLLKFKKGNLMPEVINVPHFTGAARWGNGWGQGTGEWQRDREADDSRRGRYGTHTTQTSRTTERRRNGWNATMKTAGATGYEGNYKVLVNNKYEPIPEGHKEMVENWYCLDTTQDVYFKPKRFMKWGNSKGTVIGSAFHPEWCCWFDAVIHHVSIQQYDSHGDYPWTVKVSGIDHRSYVPQAPSGLAFICNVLWFSWTDKEPEEEVPAETSHDVTDCMPGPHGHYIDLDAWNYLTESGCVMCQQPILPDEADDLMWVGEMENQPLCYACQEDATKMTEEK